MIKGFKEFIMRGNVVDLAVAVVIGAAFGAVVTSLVDNVINPLIAAIFGKPDLSGILLWTLNDGGTPGDPADDAVLAIGTFLTAILNFLIIAAAIYFAIVLPLNKLAERKAKDEPAPDEAVSPTEIEILTEIRDAIKAQSDR
ncbi:large conductance mechanosensitive channel protein MscL [Demequina lignilytica]|uniref:Large-conductance mechanosensitive channel n=1 Tax=Demequina lignilytica TaxID=3051663 RepID=A0AB35MIK1_9MICO|nr:large conductance mechanosensitive channel protein MscL [Demequina sp. SYSU T0a273]MDN4483620.1 large conductance mechanosensitive channel protein MscL [Demequina sp. SYSU T0a273]